MSWSSQKRECIFCNTYLVWRKFFQYLYFISMYSVLNQLSKNTYPYVSKKHFMLLHIQTKHYVMHFIIIITIIIIIIIIIIILFQCFTWRYRYGIRFYFRVFYRFTNFPFTCRDRYWFIAKRLLPFSYLGAVP